MPKRFAIPADDELTAQLADADAEELAPQGESPQAVPSAPVAPITPPEPEATKTPEAVEPAKKVRLQDLEEFRQYQAEADRRVEKLRQQTLQAEARLQETLNAQQAAQAAALEARVRESSDPDEMIQAARQLGIVEAEHHSRRMQEWQRYMQGRISEEGLDPSDQRFAKVYSGDVGGAQFEADLASAKAAKWQREAEAAKQAASPENIAKVVQQQVARALAAQGFDTHDLSTPAGTAPRDDEFAADVKKLQSGAMSNTRFYKKWGESA
jgi:hypothetical protein